MGAVAEFYIFLLTLCDSIVLSRSAHMSTPGPGQDSLRHHNLTNCDCDDKRWNPPLMSVYAVFHHSDIFHTVGAIQHRDVSRVTKYKCVTSIASDHKMISSILPDQGNEERLNTVSYPPKPIVVELPKGDEKDVVSGLVRNPPRVHLQMSDMSLHLLSNTK